MHLTRLHTICCWLALAGCLLLLPTSARAVTRTVTTLADSGGGSLRDILDNVAQNGDTITFAVTGTIVLGGTELAIDKSLAIQGPGAHLLTISGNNASRVFNIGSVTPAINVTLSGLTIANGRRTSFGALGGGIFNASTGTLNVINSTLANNSASPNGGGNTGQGGGIYSTSNGGTGTLNVINSTLANNSVSASAFAVGGGIYYGNFFGTLNVINSTLTNNFVSTSGGGIPSVAWGGGIFIGGTVKVNVTNSTLANNSASASGGTGNNNAVGGGIMNSGGTVTVTSTIVALNSVTATGNNPSAQGPDVFNPFTSQGFNLIGNPVDSTGFTAPTDLLNQNPLLGALANNGGPTPTLALLAGSPAIDKGISNGLATDQRGFARTVDFVAIANASDGTDIGAFERNFNDTDSGLTRASDSKVGSLLVFPYYTSTIGGGVNVPFTNFGPATLETQGGSDTRMTISNISNAASTVANQAYVHLFLIEGTTCQAADFFLCLTPNASFSFKASDYDPGNTGYVIAVAVNNQGVPVQNNVLIGNAFLTTPTIADNYGAEAFWANSPTVAIVSGNTATLAFDNNGYDAVPSQFAVEIQSPLDTAGQQIITASLSGNLNTSQLTGAAQVGTGQAFNEKEAFGSFQNWLLGTCQARGTISTASPRVPNGLGNLIRTGQAGYLKFNVGGAVGLLLTPRGGAWTGIRTLHKTQTVATTLTIPIFVPVC